MQTAVSGLRDNEVQCQVWESVAGSKVAPSTKQASKSRETRINANTD